MLLQAVNRQAVGVATCYLTWALPLTFFGRCVTFIGHALLEKVTFSGRCVTFQGHALPREGQKSVH